MQTLFGWRSTLLALSMIGVITLAVIAWRLNETLHETRPDSLQPHRLLTTWMEILAHHTFWAYGLYQTATFAGLYVFLAASPFVFMEVLAYSALRYGSLMVLMSVFYIAGTFLCRYLLSVMSIRQTLLIGALLSLTGGTLVAISAFMDWYHFWGLMLPYCIYIIGHGINQPCAQVGVMGPFPHAAGAASALSSFLMTLGTFIIGFWLGRAMDDTVAPMALGIWFCGVSTAIIGFLMVARVAAYITPENQPCQRHS